MFKKIVFTGLALLVILATVASPAAANGNGWYISDPYQYGEEIGCSEVTGAILMPVAVNFDMPPGVKTAIMSVYVDDVVVKSEEVIESGIFTAGTGSPNRSFTVKFVLTFHGVAKSSEKIFTNTCPVPAR